MATRFKVGDLVTFNPSMETVYTYTSKKALCVVNRIRECHDYDLEVTIVAHEEGKHYSGEVESKYFVHCTYAEFMERHPNATLTSTYSAEELRAIKNSESEVEEKEMELRMNAEKIGQYDLTAEERETLRNQMVELLKEYDYSPTEYGLNQILDEWIANKGWMVNLFRNHPNYNGKFQIVFDSDYQRNCNKAALSNFAHYLRDMASSLRKEAKIGAFTLAEIEDICDRLYTIKECMGKIRRNNHHVLVDGKTFEEIKKEHLEWVARRDAYTQAYYRDEVYIYYSNAYTATSWNTHVKIRNVADNIECYTEHIVNDEMADYLNHQFPELKAVAGQKMSRIINKLCTMLGINKDPDYNREFALYSDAINPLTIKRHTVLSCNPLDYLTMSFGNSWASCHTIDKFNKRDMPNAYSGQYSSGTLSYMLDSSSFVFYTVDKDYNGNELELQPKINRNMFHIGKDKLVQGRVYPQTTDGENGIYKQIREIAQKVIADCLGVPNMWKNVKGTSACNHVIDTYGTHYPDYIHFSDCNVSYLKDETECLNEDCITVGHSPICPHCGRRHGWADAVECEDCYDSGRKTCERCGRVHDEDDMHYIDGEWYCESCCFYCAYHEQWELYPEDSNYIEGYGRVCDDALNYSDDFEYCGHCEEWFFVDNDVVRTEDGSHFCCAEHAINGGYLETSDGKWYPEDEVFCCDECGAYVHDSQWNSEQECCVNCAELVIEELETETTETEETLAEAV